jgi:hypothetical protein
VTTPPPYTPEQTFARDLLIAAINGGINRWARVHGYSIDVPADQVRPEGVDIADRAIWTVTLVELEAAMNKLVADPHLSTSSDQRHPSWNQPGAGPGRSGHHPRCVREARRRVNPASGRPFYGDLMSRISETADVVVQVALAGEVIY